MFHKLTDGATISPASGTPQDFTTPVTYTVLSEDKNWHKEYTVSLLRNTVSSKFSFENWKLTPESNYYTPYEIVNDEDQDVWASGNSGFALVAPEQKPEAYPTQRSMDAVEGTYAIYLETKSTGALGSTFGKPIAAGNLFLGSFDVAKSLTAPLEATIFGVPFNKKPLSFTGFYKYVSAGNVTGDDGKVVVPNRIDECDMYAVLFKTSASKPFLDGSNILSDPSVVATAQLTNGGNTPGNGYRRFDIPFQFKSEIDEGDLASYGYKLTIVFTSSKTGAIFQGAVGSKLFVDNVEIETE